MNHLLVSLDRTKRCAPRPNPLPPMKAEDMPVVRAERAVEPGRARDPRCQDYCIELKHEWTVGHKTLWLRVMPSKGECKGVMVYVHGGGFVFGAKDEEDKALGLVSVDGSLMVVSVGYRLAPEHPHPTQQEDVTSALHWLSTFAGRQFMVQHNRNRDPESPKEIRLVVDTELKAENQDPDTPTWVNKVLISGESAGAYLAAQSVANLYSRFNIADFIKGSCLMYGCYNTDRSPSSYDVPDHIPLAPYDMELFLDLTFTKEQRASRDPSINALYNPYLRETIVNGTNKVLIIAGTNDILYDDSAFFFMKLAKFVQNAKNGIDGKEEEGPVPDVEFRAVHGESHACFDRSESFAKIVQQWIKRAISC
ncbi:alpha/beta hydrolase fold protein [Gregarina niphandrodes]|uniref:Alpha/beta hydrolase fold protein n=1 Tax=Gregarina niphandrodes TaxID=110365 RepID=A0A023BCG3_GRENI|nr:alpha/beta hydrolase fold protein [Gregarina niphandrodes]EZG83931.1 alpha/beta hydrolase fold protein [Gregarina niphandrodes]|eukprot:XP_011128884.1 alpha/beta hydrolase fold protein [Gregarina niphandrodes]